MSLPLVITRPQPGADATARRAEEMGLRPVVAPLFTIVPKPWDVPDVADVDAVLISSANAVRFGGDQLSHLSRLPALAVGAASADAARAAGFGVAFVGSHGVQSAIDHAAQSGRNNLLWLAGVDRTDFDASAVLIRIVETYEAQHVSPAPVFPEQAVIMVHSARAAQRVAEILDDKSAYQLIAISSVVAQQAGFGWARREIADAPNDAAMLALAKQMCQ